MIAKSTLQKMMTWQIERSEDDVQKMMNFLDLDIVTTSYLYEHKYDFGPLTRKWNCVWYEPGKNKLTLGGYDLGSAYGQPPSVLKRLRRDLKRIIKKNSKYRGPCIKAVFDHLIPYVREKAKVEMLRGQVDNYLSERGMPTG